MLSSETNKTYKAQLLLQVERHVATTGLSGLGDGPGHQMGRRYMTCPSDSIGRIWLQRCKISEDSSRLMPADHGYAKTSFSVSVTSWTLVSTVAE